MTSRAGLVLILKKILALMFVVPSMEATRLVQLPPNRKWLAMTSVCPRLLATILLSVTGRELWWKQTDPGSPRYNTPLVCPVMAPPPTRRPGLMPLETEPLF